MKNAPHSITLAPMEGVLDHRLRHLLTAIGGIDRCVTEFIRVTHNLVPNKVITRIYPEHQNNSLTLNNTMVTPQLLGDNSAKLAENALKLCDLGAPQIDLNFGCPAKTVNNSGGGSILLKEPERIYDIVRTIKQALPSHITLSAKMRLGFTDKVLAIDNAQAMEAGGATELVVHARTKKEGYKPPAHYEYIAKINAATRIKIIANGEMWTLSDIDKCIDISGVNDIMIGRGLLACPDLALQAKGSELPSLTWPDICQLLLVYLDLLQTDCSEKYRHALIKQWLVYLRCQYGDAFLFFEKIKRTKGSEDIQLALKSELKEKRRAARMEYEHPILTTML